MSRAPVVPAFRCVFFRTFCRSGVALFLLLPLLAAMSGCTADFKGLPSVSSMDGERVPIGNLSGSVHGGQAPIWNSHVYLMKATTSGYGLASLSMLNAGGNTTADTTVLGTPAKPAYYVTSDGTGNWNITGDYTCAYNSSNPALSDQLYMLSLNGNTSFIPGSPPTGGVMNPSIGLMAVLGQCPSDGTFAGHLNYIIMNEVSTVAAGYALAGFATKGNMVSSGSSTQSMQGLANAMANADQLYDIQNRLNSSTHEARTVTPAGNGVVPYKTIDTLANILASCINATAGTACTTLSTYGGGYTDTASNLIWIAQHPSVNITNLYALQASYVQFADSLGTKPNDFSVGIIYSSTALNSPVGISIDATGNAFVSSSGQAASISKFSPLGVLATGFPVGTLASSYNEIDTSGNVWAATTSNVMEYSNAGTLISGSPYTAGGAFSQAMGIATDGSGNTYVANYNGGNGAVVNLAPNGNFIRISGSGSSATYSTLSSTNLNLLTITTNNFSQPTTTAADQADYFWATFPAINRIARINSSGTASFRNTVGSLTTPASIALDSANNGWTTWTGSNAISKTTSGGSSTSYTGGGLNSPKGIAIDGANNLFIANSAGPGSGTTGSVSEGTSAAVAVTVPASGTGGTTGYAAQANLGTTTGIAVDLSGNVWTTNSSTNTLTEFIGLGVPVVTPLANFTGVASNNTGNMP